MNVNRSDMADLVYFCAIARHRSFSKAAVELGVSASTLSHALKGFEARLGVRLLNRTTKSVTLTAAGESLASAVSEPVAAIDGAIEQLNQFRDSPAGHIRLNVAVEAATLLLAPILPVFAERYPDIELDIVASNRIVDVTEARFDAGIRYGGTGRYGGAAPLRRCALGRRRVARLSCPLRRAPTPQRSSAPPLRQQPSGKQSDL